MAMLSDVTEGQSVRIVEIPQGTGNDRRLSDLGFIKGALVKVLKNDAGMPMVVEIKGARLVLGRKLCSMISIMERAECS